MKNSLKAFGIVAAYLAAVLFLAAFCMFLVSKCTDQHLGIGLLLAFATLVVVASCWFKWASPFWELVEGKRHTRHSH